jgi:hypothetical protein
VAEPLMLPAHPLLRIEKKLAAADGHCASRAEVSGGFAPKSQHNGCNESARKLLPACFEE